MNKITLRIDASPQNPVSLADAAAEQFINGNVPAHLIITLEAAADVAIQVVDDLATTHEVVVKHEITLIAHKRATIDYRMKATMPNEGQEQMSATTIEKHITTRLVGQHATINVHSACYASGKQVYKFNTLQDHVVADTTSNLMIKAICDDTARLNSNNMIRIHKGAQRSNAEQANKNILLSKTARAVSVPQLEIEANDVRCKHGAAVSMLNEEQIFYLQSRGIGATQTRDILVQAFLAG